MALKVGDKAPGFSLKNQDDKDVSIDSLLGQVPMVIYFYPKNFTPGCTAQACSFRDQYQDFTDAGAKVFGISADSVASHKRFKAKHNLPFDTLSDQKNKIRRLYGVKNELLGLLPGRETFVIDATGTVKMRFNSMMAVKHIPKALSVIKGL
ncbi:peroxiredoxin [Dokdonia donghaensis]|uniref:peroxiredoxin n=1 Tax=Dokdonia donghaensis TaxID=326320 RepID=UPI0035C81DF8